MRRGKKKEVELTPSCSQESSTHDSWQVECDNTQCGAEEKAREQAEAAEAERVKQQKEFEEAMGRWRLPPELDEQLVQHADLSLGANRRGKIPSTTPKSARYMAHVALRTLRARHHLGREPTDFEVRNFVPGAAAESELGCVIPLTERRAITINQLYDVWDKVTDWSDKDIRWPTAEVANLYNLCELLIKPETSTLGCSYVETVATGEQVPVWFVSHWWGEPVQAFVACVGQHAIDHGLCPGTPYWVRICCTFCFA